MGSDKVESSENPATSTSAGSKRQSTLSTEMSRELLRWKRATWNYGVIYYTSRIILIVGSCIVAADQNLRGTNGSSLVRWVPMLSLLVAILAGLDTWLKPLEKWRGFMESRDRLASLISLVENGMDLAEAQGRFDVLRAEHREKNIF